LPQVWSSLPVNAVPSGSEPVRMSCLFGASPRPFTISPFSVSAPTRPYSGAHGMLGPGAAQVETIVLAPAVARTRLRSERGARARVATAAGLQAR